MTWSYKFKHKLKPRNHLDSFSVCQSFCDILVGALWKGMYMLYVHIMTCRDSLICGDTQSRSKYCHVMNKHLDFLSKGRLHCACMFSHWSFPCNVGVWVMYLHINITLPVVTWVMLSLRVSIVSYCVRTVRLSQNTMTLVVSGSGGFWRHSSLPSNHSQARMLDVMQSFINALNLTIFCVCKCSSWAVYFPIKYIFTFCQTIDYGLWSNPLILFIMGIGFTDCDVLIVTDPY